jgi:hypothetical protein
MLLLRLPELGNVKLCAQRLIIRYTQRLNVAEAAWGG